MYLDYRKLQLFCQLLKNQRDKSIDMEIIIAKKTNKTQKAPNLNISSGLGSRTFLNMLFSTIKK